MGKTLMGSSKQSQVGLLTPEQQQLLGGMLGPQQQMAGQEALTGLLQPQGLGDIESMFQQSMIDPAMQALERQIIPGIQERFAGGGALSSSALNQALSQAATDVATGLGSQFGQFAQKQQELGQRGQLGGLSALLGLLGQKAFQATRTEKPGILGPLLTLGGGIAGGPMGAQIGSSIGNMFGPGQTSSEISLPGTGGPGVSLGGTRQLI